MGLEVSHLNKGRIDMIRNCSWRYWRSYQTEEPSQDSLFGSAGAAFLGSALHNALENFYNKGEMTKSALLTQFDKECENNPLNASDYADGRDILDGWFDRNEELMSDKNRKTILNEAQFGYSPRHDEGTKMTVGGVPLHGYIDRIDEVKDGEKKILEVIDYKSNQRPYARVDIDDEQNAEVNIYLIAARKMFPGYDEYIFVYDMLRWGRFETTRSKKQLVEYLRYMQRIYKYATNLDEPKQTLGLGCNWCGYQEECDAFQETVEMGISPPGADFNFDNLKIALSQHQKISAAASGMYRKKAQIEERIRTLLESNDMMSFEDGDVRINMKASKETKYDSKEVIDALIHDKDLLAEVISVGKGKMDKIIKELPLETRDRLIRTQKVGFRKASLNMKIKE